MKFDVIVVDPPWAIKKIQRKVRPNQTEIDYITMPVEEIKALPIGCIAADSSVCFLWTIQKYLESSFEVIRGWGFKPIVTLTWDKQNGLCLFGFHWRTEFVVVGRRGKIPMYPSRKAMPTVFSESSWRRHSVKPSTFYQYAEQFGNDRIDIFAREFREDWYCIGNELTGKDIITDLKEAMELNI